MSDKTGQFIDGLFDRLQQAEAATGERDQAAESQINKHLVKQPAAPYYMAQTIIMQEAALKKMHEKVAKLEQQLATAEPSSGGFLAGLFGSPTQDKSKAQSGWTEQAENSTRTASKPTSDTQYRSQSGAGRAQTSGASRSFLGGALQTAAGVAGGMVVGNMLMSMFGHHTANEMVDVIEEQPIDQADSSGNTDFADNSDFSNSNDFGDNQNGFGQAGFEPSNDMGSSDFSSSNGFADNSFSDNSFSDNGFADTGFSDNSFSQGGFDDLGGMDDFGDDFDI